MANVYDNGAGLGVNNHYGPRSVGGTAGITKTEGGENEFTVNLDDVNLGFEFPFGINVEKVYVIGIQDAYADAAVTALTIGGVDVALASEASPIELDAATNSGVMAITGPSAGTVVVKYISYKG